MKRKITHSKVLPRFLFLLLIVLFFAGGCATRSLPDPKYSVKVNGEKVDSEHPAGPAEPSAQDEVSDEHRKEIQAPSQDAGASGKLSESVSDSGASSPPGEKPSPSVLIEKGADTLNNKAPLKVQRTKEEVQATGTSGTDKSSKADEPVIFNFDNADIVEVIRNISGLLNINYMFDVKVEGTVTIHTVGKLSKKDIWPVFFQILEANGLTAVEKDNLYHIVNLKDAQRMPINSYVGGSGDGLKPNESIIIQIIPLKYISPQEMTKLLTPFINESGQIISHDQSNILAVVDSSSNIPKILKLARIFDMDVFERMNYRFYPLDYANVEDVVKTLQAIFSTYGGPKGGSGVAFIGLNRLNKVLAIGSTSQLFEKLDELIKQLDAPGEGSEPQIYVYSLQNGQAAEIGALLNLIFTQKSSAAPSPQGQAKKASTPKNPLSREALSQISKESKKTTKGKEYKAPPKESPAPTILSGDKAFNSGTLRGEVKITPDETRNSLVIEAIPSDYRIIKELLHRIDVLPRQVLIEMTIAEVTLDKKTEMGVEWSYLKGTENLNTSLLSASMGQSGLNFVIGRAERLTSALSALASENKVNILSSPSILASNSKNAKIDITTEIPVSSSQYQYTSGENPVVETAIEYRDTGVILSVTPNINEAGLVTMDLEQEVSELAENIQVGSATYPSFFKRSAQTTLAVKDGQTIVIGGLIRENKSNGASGTPWFNSIPILNFLLGSKKDSFSKTELIILISPHVITSLDDVEAVSEEFKKKVAHIIPKEN